MMQKALVLAMFLVCIAIIGLETRMNSLRDELKSIKADNTFAAEQISRFEMHLLNEMRKKEAQLEKQQSAEAAAVRDDLKALPSDNFRQGATWGNN
jgi:hypothetical protein